MPCNNISLHLWFLSPCPVTPLLVLLAHNGPLWEMAVMGSPCDSPTQLSLVSRQAIVAIVKIVAIVTIVAIVAIVAILAMVDNGVHEFPLGLTNTVVYCVHARNSSNSSNSNNSIWASQLQYKVYCQNMLFAHRCCRLPALVVDVLGDKTLPRFLIAQWSSRGSAFCLSVVSWKICEVLNIKLCDVYQQTASYARRVPLQRRWSVCAS